ncbi:MAG: hypothetical protein JWM56_539 [Candidatus Peribacteria bacterium]|nr:hypothetical protein [Candidatus Peribacteria bacterium]
MVHVRRFFSGLLLCLLIGSHQQAHAAAKPMPDYMSTIRIDDVLRQFHITADRKTLIAITADAPGNQIAFLFRNKNNQFKLYVNTKLLITGTQKTPHIPAVFRFTEDGHLLSAVNPTQLFYDATQLSSMDNAFEYDRGTTTVYENAGRLYFPETHRIRMFDTRTGTSVTLHEHPDGTVEYLRGHGQDLFYTLTEKGNAYLYVNGTKLVETPVENPSNFLVLSNGDVAFFAHSGDNYILYKNTIPYFTAKGYGGFLFEDPKGNLWHAAFDSVTPTDVASYNVHLYKNKEEMKTPPLSNLEGFIDFHNDSYATRAAKKGETAMYLLKDGKLVGQPFSFSHPIDFQGVQLDTNNIAYMRNYAGNRWQLLANGEPLFQTTFRNIWFFQKVGTKLRVFGSTF